LFVSIPKDMNLDPFSISFDEAIVLIQKKQELEKNKYINEFVYEKEKIQILNGPY
jgi:topoisomerase IA-like protein